jgi:uridine kinase
MNELFNELIKSHAKLSLYNANEAETRIKLIDRLVYEVLGWKYDDVSYEERVTEDGNTTFADYILRTANTALLIEAKRIGKTFNTIPSKRKTKLSGSLMNDETGEAIRQAREYCRKKSIPFGVVTNGSHWILFPAIRIDQIEFSSSNAILFDSIENYLGSEFDYFHSLLSRDGVINGTLEYELIGRNEDQIEERRLKVFYKATYTSPQNPIYPLIENAIVTAFTDSIFESESTLLEKCYVSTPDRTKFDSRIKMHLSKREPLFKSHPKKPMKKKDADALSTALLTAQNSARPLAILILGPVGSGKTTFLQYTRKVTTKEYFEIRKDRLYPHWMQIDFREFVIEKSPIEFIIKTIFEYMKTDLFFSDFNSSIKNAYYEEIKALQQGPMYLISKNSEKFEEKISELITNDYKLISPYVEKLLTYSVSKIPVFIVIDNVDQHDDEEIQGAIFSEAIAFASKLKLNLVVSMRESTYIKHRHTPTFDAFDFDPIQLEPPQILPVLSRRFFVAQQLLSGKSGSFTALNGARFDVSDLSIFINLVQESVLGTEIGKRIEVLSNGDVRLSLRMTREFLERGYTDPAKAIENYSNRGSYILPRHEAFRSILLGNQSVYQEEYSVIGNPFDSRLNKNNAQPLRLFILAALVKLSGEKSFEYLDGPTIRENLRKIGYNDVHILKTLSDLCRLRFVHTASHGEANFNSNYYPSKLGGYIIRDLIGDFTFVENVLMDTFIASKDIWESLKKLSEIIKEERNTIKRLEARIKRVKLFYDYNQELYNIILAEAERRILTSEWCSNPLSEMKDKLYANCDFAITSAKKNYS